MNGASGQGLFSRVQAFIFSSFTSAASTTNWFLFVGAILIAAYLWRYLLSEFEDLI